MGAALMPPFQMPVQPSFTGFIPRPPEDREPEERRDDRPAPPPGFVRPAEASFERTIAQPAIGFNEVMTAILGGPGDLINSGLRRFGAINNVLPGTEDIRNGFDLVGAMSRPTDLPPQNPVEETLRNAGRVGAQTTALSLPIVGGAVRSVPTPGTPAFQRFISPSTAARGGSAVRAGFRQVGADIAANPRITFGIDILGGFGAGAGENIGQLASPESDVAPVIGGIVGGLSVTAVSMSPSVFIARAFRKQIMPVLSTQSRTRMLVEFMDKSVGRLSGQEMEQLREAQRAMAEIRGLRLTLAEATDNPALIAGQRAREFGLSGEQLSARRARIDANKKAIVEFSRTRAPSEVADDTKIVFDTAQNRVEQVSLRIAAAKRGLLGEQEELARAIPRINQADAGSALRDAARAAQTGMREQMTRRADELGLNTEAVTPEFTALGKAIRKEFLATQRTSFNPDDVKPRALDFLQDRIKTFEAAVKAGDEVEPFTIQDVMNLRSLVSDDLQDALASTSPNSRLIGNLIKLKDIIDDQVGKFELPGRFSDNWRIFRKEYFEDFIDPFDNNTVFRLRNVNKRGFYVTPDEKIAGAFMRDGIEGARRFKQVFADDADAKNTMFAAIMDLMHRDVVRDGTVQPRLLETFLRKNDGFLREFPELRAAVTNTDDANTALLQRMRTLDAREKAVNATLLSREIAALNRGTRTTEQEVTRLVQNPARMRTFLNSIRDNPGAIRALKQAVWLDATGMDATEMGRYMQRHHTSLRMLLGDQHYNDLQIINRAMSMVERLPVPQGVPVSADPLQFFRNLVGQSPESVAAQINLAFGVRNIGQQYFFTRMFGLFFRRRSLEHAQATFDELLFNPDLARNMADIAFLQAQAPKTKVRFLNDFLFSLGFDPGAGKIPENKRDEAFEEALRGNID